MCSPDTFYNIRVLDSLQRNVPDRGMVVWLMGTERQKNKDGAILRFDGASLREWHDLDKASWEGYIGSVDVPEREMFWDAVVSQSRVQDFYHVVFRCSDENLEFFHVAGMSFVDQPPCKG